MLGLSYSVSIASLLTFVETLAGKDFFRVRKFLACNVIAQIDQCDVS